MDGLLEAKSEPKWKFLLRTVRVAGVFKLCSVYGKHVPLAQDVLIISMLYYVCTLSDRVRPTIKASMQGYLFMSVHKITLSLNILHL